MKRYLKSFVFVSLLSTLALASAPSTLAESTAGDDAPAADAGVVEKGKSPRGIPYGGTLSAVDKSAMTITLSGKATSRTFLITPQTKIHKEGQPASLEDAVTGEKVGVSYRKIDDGKYEALTLRLGPKPEKATKTANKTKTDPDMP